MASWTLPHRVLRSRRSRPGSQSRDQCTSLDPPNKQKKLRWHRLSEEKPHKAVSPRPEAALKHRPQHVSEAAASVKRGRPAAMGLGVGKCCGTHAPRPGAWTGLGRESRGPCAGQRPGFPPGPAAHLLPGQSVPGAESSPSSPSCPSEDKPPVTSPCVAAPPGPSERVFFLSAD